MSSDFLRLSSLSTAGVKEDAHGYLIHATATTEARLCPSCQSASIRKYGAREQVYNDCPIHGKHVSILVQRQRYRCNDCKKLWHEEINDLSGQRRVTNRLKEYIEKHSLKRTFVDVAEETGIDEKTIRNIFRDYVYRLAEEIKFEHPKWLGIDEIHIISKPRVVITNIEMNTVVEMLPNRNKASILKYFDSIESPHDIHYVAMDMWRPYRDAVYERIPHVQVIVDKFHVVRMANDAMEAVRKAVRKNLSSRERRTLMHDRFVLLKRLHDLTDEEYLKFSSWVENFPLLGKAYTSKEGFYAIWDQNGRDEAEAAYDRWVQDLSIELVPYFSDLVRAAASWRNEIFNYFDHPIANAYTESLNNLIRVMNRLGRGYSFDALRAKILFTEGVQRHRKKNRSRGRRRNQAEMAGTFSMVMTSPQPDKEISSENYGADIATLVRWIEENRL
ncbi:MAG: ISL3 family transposase [gamma proteobacterium endosymbiont of Lamellibrachia anaximandri]|nr:ISL3 family transposase [gamma proteobacterium endosymbiont of Lamellibrachia anaximandri]